MPIEFQVTDAARIDNLVRKKLHYATLGDIFKLFRQGDIKLDGKRVKGKERAEKGSVVRIFADEKWLRERAKERVSSETARLTEQNFSVIHEDETLLVCNKPGGVAVHEGKGVKKGSTLIELATHYGKTQEPPFTPHLIHRLDAETSGVILLTKKKEFFEKMKEVFRSGKIDKKYVALCYGRFKNKTGTIRASLSRNSSRNRGMNVKVNQSGREAHSEYRVMHQYRGFALVEVTIFTGRTHQIRTHMAHIGHPLVGDTRYGDEERDKRLKDKLKVKTLRLFLHALEIGFPLPDSGKYVKFSSDLPREFKQLGARSNR